MPDLMEDSPQRTGAPVGEIDATPVTATEDSGVLAVPSTVEETGLKREFLHGLILRFLYERGGMTGEELSNETRLLFSLLDPELRQLKNRLLLDVTGQGTGLRQYATFRLTEEGKDRARASAERTPYVGPAPVPFEQYRKSVLRYSHRGITVSREKIESALDHLVLHDQFIDALGPAVTSRTTLFLYGPTGNGKSALARAVAGMYGNDFYVPHAVEVDGHVIDLFDPLHHEPVEDEGTGNAEGWLRELPSHDPRYVAVHRPVVTVGGELTLDQLELVLDPALGVLRAPPQMKANGGVFIVDDFGRQRVRARDLLNRWMVPLEDRVDYLSIPSGRKLPVPFETQIIFATNLHPAELVEEAFLRRIRYKIFVGSPSRSAYEEIYRRECEKREVDYRPEAVEYLYREYYDGQEIPVRACHPRDLVSHVVDIADYLSVDPDEPENATRMLRLAGETYFLDIESFEREAGQRFPFAPEDETHLNARGPDA